MKGAEQTSRRESAMIEREVNIPTADGTAQAFLFHPDTGGPFPVVVYETDIRGIRPVFMDMARKVAAAGYAVLLPNLFYRVSLLPVIDPALAWGSDACMARFGELFTAVTPDGLTRDHAAILKFLETIPDVAADRVALVGYCMGGTAAFRVAGTLPDKFALAASFHGGRLANDAPDSPHLNADKIQALLYFGHAADDASMTPEMIGRLEAALDAAHVEHVTDHYAARHGYAVKDNPAYDAAAEERHWERLFEMLGRTFGR
jgi:carboxymethylenebutenolidase